MRTIYSLQRKGAVRGAYIARELNKTKPTVSVSLRELEKEGYLVRLEDHSVVLTPKGMVIAREITDRNTGLYELLISLGISETTALKDACAMEHAISQESFCALVALGECRSSCRRYALRQDSCQ